MRTIVTFGTTTTGPAYHGDRLIDQSTRQFTSITAGFTG